MLAYLTSHFQFSLEKSYYTENNHIKIRIQKQNIDRIQKPIQQILTSSIVILNYIFSFLFNYIMVKLSLTTFSISQNIYSRIPRRKSIILHINIESFHLTFKCFGIVICQLCNKKLLLRNYKLANKAFTNSFSLSYFHKIPSQIIKKPLLIKLIAGNRKLLYFQTK